ncbi:hypothetical protein VTN96DRAFT_1143 [Rasamsonia emersonii]
MHRSVFSEYPPPASLSGSPYILEMSDFFAYQAERALEDDSETAQSLFSDLALQSTCQPLSMAPGDFSTVSGAGYCVLDPSLSFAPYTGSQTAGTYDESTLSSNYFLEEPLAHPYTMPSSPYLDADLTQVHHHQQPHVQLQSQSQSQSRRQQQQRTPHSPSLRSESPDTGDLTNYGIRNADGTWRCAHVGCSSRTVFTRACDLRKHFNRHNKYLFCRYEGCPQATEGGFSSKKDRARHEAKHNPEIKCEWKGCGRVFSRVDNMKDHVRRIHKKRSE